MELEHLGVRWDDEPIPVVYAIIHVLDGDIYFGETCNASARKWQHHIALRRHIPPNYLLRDACPLGFDDSLWRYVVLEEVHGGRWRRLDRERWWIVHVPTCINAVNDGMAAEFWALLGR